MLFTDFSPPANPSRRDQQDALQKGLGRAVQWASAGRLREPLLVHACLHDERYDYDIEGPRGDWLWGIIEAAGWADRLRVRILHALYELPEAGSVQLCELARNYAAAGDKAFRTRLYEIVEQKPFPDAAWMGEDEILQLDGLPALSAAAQARGRRLQTADWEWDDEHLIDNANEQFGEGQVANLLSRSADPDVKSYWNAWQDVKRQKKQRKEEKKRTRAGAGPRPSRRDELRAVPVAEVLEAAETAGSCVSFRGWGMYAAEAELQAVLERLRTSQEPAVLARLLHVFSNRALPEFDPWLIDLCRHNDADVRRRAYCALEPNAHPLVREFALSELGRPGREAALLGLFINNYQPGDEALLLDALELPDDDFTRHSMLFDLIKVLETNAQADSSRLGVVAYASTPCGTCRYYAARLLYERNCAPDWLKDECKHDAVSDTRVLPAVPDD